MVETFGERPRPWALAVGFEVSSEFANAIRRQIPTVIFASSPKKQAFRERDFDILIVRGDLDFEPSEHLFVLQFGGTGEYELHYRLGVDDRYDVEDGFSRVFDGPDAGAPDDVKILVRESLAPWLLTQRPHGIISRSVDNAYVQSSDDEGIVAFIRERGGRPCAGYWIRPDQGTNAGIESTWWWLPLEVPNQEKWIRLALSSWRTSNSDMFSSDANEWRTDPQWMTLEEIAATGRVRAAEIALTEGTRKLQVELDRERDAVLALQISADSTVRRLLTQQGDELKDAVQQCLLGLGFQVIDSDTVRRKDDAAAALFEDLQVIDNEWVAVVEVRGYQKSGGKSADFQRIARAAVNYERRNGKEPDARWYILNHQIQLGPSDRRRSMGGAADDLEVFSEDHGLVVDTRDLFKLAKSVESSVIEARTARRLLRESVGIFQIDDNSSSTQPRQQD